MPKDQSQKYLHLMNYLGIMPCISCLSLIPFQVTTDQDVSKITDDRFQGLFLSLYTVFIQEITLKYDIAFKLLMLALIGMMWEVEVEVTGRGLLFTSSNLTPFLQSTLQSSKLLSPPPSRFLDSSAASNNLSNDHEFKSPSYAGFPKAERNKPWSQEKEL